MPHMVFCAYQEVLILCQKFREVVLVSACSGIAMLIIEWIWHCCRKQYHNIQWGAQILGARSPWWL